MAVKGLSVRVIVEQTDDTGGVATKVFDETYPLSGFTGVQPGLRVRVATNADDLAISHVTPAMVMLASHDEPISVRLADGETLIQECVLFLAVAYQTPTAMGQLLSTSSLLVTGNGDTPADVESWYVETA